MNKRMTVLCSFSLLLFCGGAAIIGHGMAQENSNEIFVSSKEIEQRIDELNRQAHFPVPMPKMSDLERILDGKVVRIREHTDNPDEPQRIVAYMRSTETRDALWLTARDIHYSAVDELLEVKVSDSGKWPTRWYQFLDLPWPFADRVWMVDVNDNLPLARNTNNAIWEHYWYETEGGPALARRLVVDHKIPSMATETHDAAVYAPLSRGAWVLFELSDGSTIVIYHAATIIGGKIPDHVVANYAYATLDNMLRRIDRRAKDELRDHYVVGHDLILGGDHQPIHPDRIQVDKTR